MAMTLAELLVKVTGEDAGARATLKAVRGDLDATEASGRKMGAGMKAASVAAATTLGLMAAASTRAVRDASDLSEATNKAANTFGDAAASIPGYTGSVAKSLGMSRAAALDNAAGIGAMVQAMGASQGESARMSTNVLKLAADLGSFHNQDPTEMLDRLRAGLSGESEPLKRFGILLTEARVKAEAMRLGLASNGQELTEHAKLQARMSLIVRDSAVAQNDFAETSNGVANSTRIVASQVTDLSATLGGQLLPVVAAALGALVGFISFVQANATAFQVLATVVATVAAGILAYTAYVKAAAAATAIWNAVMKANTLVLVISILIAFGVALVAAYKQSETFRNIVNASFNAVRGVVQAVATFVTQTVPAAFGAVVGWVRSNWPIIATLISGPFAPLVALATDAFGIRSRFTAAIRSLLGAVRSVFGSIVGAIVGFAGQLYNAAQGVGMMIVSGIGAGMEAMVGWLVDKARSIARAPIDAAKAVLSISSPSRVAADEVGKPIVQGIAQGIMTSKGLMSKAAVQTVRDAIANAKNEARSAAGTIANVIGQVVDERASMQLAALDTSEEAKRIRDIEKQQSASARASERARLDEALANAQTDAERQAAVKAIADWELEQERQRLSEGLAARRQAISDEAAARKAAADKNLADLTESFNRGLISQKEYLTALTGILRAEGVSFQSVGELLGTAVAYGFQDALTGITRFVRGITRNEGLLGISGGFPVGPDRPPSRRRGTPRLTGVARFGRDTLVQAHPGETLLTAREAADWRAGQSGGGTVQVVVQGNTLLADAPEVADRIARLLQPALSRLVTV